MSAAKRLLKIACLDDYQLASKRVDWSKVQALGGSVEVFQDTLHDEDALVERLEPFDIICTMRERTPFPKSLIDRLPNLRFLTTTAARNLALDLPAFAARQIPVVTAKGGSGVSSGTTEHTWSLILGALKGLTRDHNAVMAGAGRQDQPWQTATNPAIGGKATLGLIGFGRLGQALLPVARALSFKSVVAWSPNLTAERIADAGPLAEGVELASSLEDLLERADVVSLHLVSSPSTRHIIGAAQLEKMRSNAILVNTSRGALVDTKALVVALREHKIGGAALDVYEEEPLTSGNPFEGLDNVTLTPHMAYVETEQIDIWWRETVENLERWLEHGDWAPERELKA